MANPICPSGCDSPLPSVSFSQCAPEINASEIQSVFVAKANTAPFADWTAPTEWAARLDQTAAGDDKIRQLTITGDKPQPTVNTREISGGRTITTDKTHVVNITMDETNQINHDFIRYMECGGQVVIWYQTKSGHLFGGNTGIKGVNLVLDMVLNRGADEIMVFSGTATWRSKFTEERTVSPITGATVPVTFDTSLTFASANTDTEAGVTANISASNANAKFEFNAIDTPIGTPITMNINVSGSLYMTVDAPSDYLGTPYRVTKTGGGTYIGTFINGTVNAGTN